MVGDIEGGRQSLETSFGGDPYNVWVLNTLDLLDTFDQYRVVRTDNFEIMLHGSEADLLEPKAVATADPPMDFDSLDSMTTACIQNNAL